MISVFSVAIGGFFGAICRFYISKFSKDYFPQKLPLGTLFVNLTGSFLLGLLIELNLEGWTYSLAGTGFLGAFTTFSTLKLESIQIYKRKNFFIFGLYLILSYSLGILLALCGFILARS